jgi:hypothetical protein
MCRMSVKTAYEICVDRIDHRRRHWIQNNDIRVAIDWIGSIEEKGKYVEKWGTTKKGFAMKPFEKTECFF